MRDSTSPGKPAGDDRIFTVGRVLYFFLLLYLFFFSIELMSDAFKMGGRGFAEQLLNAAADPVAGLIIGFLATSLIQSSSTTTTIVVGLVASGALTIQLAVPIIMGADVALSGRSGHAVSRWRSTCAS